MSRTYSIACKDCKEILWIGQGYGFTPMPEGRAYIYRAAKHIKALEKFLFAHHSHNLLFDDDEDMFGSDGTKYDEIEYLAKT